MNRRHWLELAEPISLIGSVAGSIVATVSGQVVYAVTPVALTLSFNWVNRQRLQQLQSQQLQQSTVNAIASVEQKTKTLLVASETHLKEFIEEQFTVLSGSLQKGNEQTQQLDLISNILTRLSNDYNNRSDFQDFNLIKEKLTTLELQINDHEISKALKTLVTKQEFNTLNLQLTQAIQEQIANLPRPVQSLDLSLLIGEIKKINQLNIAEIQDLSEKLTQKIEILHRDTCHLEPSKTHEIAALTIKQELDNVAEVLTELVEEIVNKSLTSNLKQELIDYLNTNLDHSFKPINSNLQPDNLTLITPNLIENIEQKIGLIIDNKLSVISEIVTYKNSNYQYQFIIDRPQGRQILIQALKQAKKQLILVSPGITQNCLDAHNNEIRNLCQQFLKQGGILKIGYGKFKHIKQKKIEQENYYSGLDYFKNIASTYPNQCQLKLLGTHESFLICDQDFAMFGSYEFLTYSDKDPEGELGIKTNNPILIKQLIKRFDNALNPNLKANHRNHQSGKNNNFSRESVESTLSSNSLIFSAQCRFCNRTCTPGSDLCLSCSR